MNRLTTPQKGVAKVLLVEDDPGDQELTRRALSNAPFPSELHIVQDGQAALDYLFRKGPFSDEGAAPRPNLIVLDLNLPRINGMDVLRRIRETSFLRQTAVVVFSTSRREEDIRDAYELGANSYIPKPVEWDEFIRVVQSLDRYWFGVAELAPTQETNYA